MIYIVVLVLLICLSLRYDINEKTKYRDQWYFVMLIVFILIAGLRWRLMVDTPNYIDRFYHRTPTLQYFSFEDYPIGKDPFYALINSIVKTFGGRFYIVQLIEASTVNILIFKYIKRHSSYLFTCLFFYAITVYLGLSMETMRASFSIVICLYANDYILDKKWIKGYMLFFLALMFHAQTIVMFVLPLLFFLRLNRLGVVVLVSAFFLGYILQVSLGDYVELLELGDEIGDKAASYAESDKFSGSKGGLGHLLIRIMPTIVYPLLALFYVKRVSPCSSILKIEPFVMMGVFFVILRINFEIAYRYSIYFSIHFFLYYSEFFVSIIQRAKNVDFKIACLRAVIIFSPFFLLSGYSKYLRLYAIYPYSSVIERRIDRNREAKYQSFDRSRPPADRDEY